MKPLARRLDLKSEVVGDEVVVYDLGTQQAHALPRFVARVCDLADGNRTVEEIAATMREEGIEEAENDSVWTALDGLGDAGLLEARVSPPAGHHLSRRRLVRGLVAASAIGAFPFAVKSIVLPSPLNAQSGDAGEATSKQTEFEQKQFEFEEKESKEGNKVECIEDGPKDGPRCSI